MPDVHLLSPEDICVSGYHVIIINLRIGHGQAQACHQITHTKRSYLEIAPNSFSHKTWLAVTFVMTKKQQPESSCPEAKCCVVSYRGKGFTWPS